MENILQGIPGVTVYIDNILIKGPDNKRHLKSLEVILSRFGSSRAHVDSWPHLLPT